MDGSKLLGAVPWQIWLIGAVVIVASVYKASGGTAANAGQAAGGAAVDAAGGFIAGISETIGDAIGLPRTNVDDCQQAINDGRMLDASKLCPASTYLRALWSGKPIAD